MRKLTIFAAAAVFGVAGLVHAELASFKGDPDTLTVCPVSGEPLGSMGDPIQVVVKDRDVRLCCDGCKPRIEGADSAKYLSKLDALMVADQKPRYPLTTDVVTGEALPADDKVVDLVHGNRLVRLGSQKSAQTFMKGPDAYLAKLNEAVIAKQKDSYPTDKCIVSGHALDEMGKPVAKVYANRLVQFCCEHCPADFEAAPTKFLSKLEKGAAPAEETDAHAEHAEHEKHN